MLSHEDFKRLRLNPSEKKKEQETKTQPPTDKQGQLPTCHPLTAKLSANVALRLVLQTRPEPHPPASGAQSLADHAGRGAKAPDAGFPP